MPCPTPGTRGCSELARAWEKGCLLPLRKLRQAKECKVRQTIDNAAALALGLEPDILADWRRRLAKEPTITNVRASEPDKQGKTNESEVDAG